MLIKRWVPEWEQKKLWKHTEELRLTITTDKHHHRHSSGGNVMLEVDTGRRHHRPRSGEFEFVRKRSKSPGLLMYLAGGRPR